MSHPLIQLLKSLFRDLFKNSSKSLEKTAILRQQISEFMERLTGRNGAVAFGAVYILFMLVISVRLMGQSAVSIDSSSLRPEIKYDDSILSVIQASPSGSLEAADLGKEIVVVFNHPMVPLAILEEKTDGVFRIEPALPGKFRWYGSRVNAFVPEGKLKPGSSYRVVVPAGTKALNGKSLKDAFEFSFETPPLELRSVTPGTEQTIPYIQSFTLNFNYPVDLETVKRFVSIESAGFHFPFNASYVTGRNESENEFEGMENASPDLAKQRVVITTTAPFRRNVEVKVRIRAGMPAAGGNRGLKEDREFAYRTYGPLEITLTEVPSFFQNSWGFDFQFSSPVDPKKAATMIHFNPPIRARNPGEGTVRSLSVYTWALQPGRQYHVVVDENFTDAAGNRITGDREFTFTMPNYRPDFNADSGSGTLESKMQIKLPVFAVNLPSIDTAAVNFDINEIQKKLQSYRYNILSDLSPRRSVWNTGVALNGAGRLGFDLTPYLPAKKSGWVAVEFSRELPGDNGRTYRESASQIVQVTDLGLVVKEAEASAHIWVNSLSTAASSAAIPVQAYGESGGVIGQCTTDASGHCEIPLSSRPDKTLYVAGRSGQDRAFVTSQDHMMYMYGISRNFDRNASVPELSGQIVFDRKLYRPGDTVQYKGVLYLRKAGVLSADTGADVKIKISNSKGESVSESSASMSRSGGVWGSFEIPRDAPLGHYSVSMSISGGPYEAYKRRGSNLIINDTFQVEEFRPVTFSVDVNGLRDASYQENIRAGISGRYLFGAPMPNAPVSWQLSRRPLSPHYERFGDFFFGDDDMEESWEAPAWSYHAGGNGHLNASGVFELPLPLSSLASAGEAGQRGRIYEMELEATVQDRDQKTVANKKYFTAFPGRNVFGIRSTDRYRHYKSEFQFELLSLDNRGEASPARARVRVEKLIWHSVQTQSPGQSIQRRNTLERQKIRESVLNLSGSPTPFSFLPEGPGTYTITLQEENGLSYTRMHFYAFGGDFISYNFNDDDSITLVPDKTSYRPGETAKILIQSPFAQAQAIVSVEREKIYYQQSFTIQGNGEPLLIPIKSEYLPDVYVSVMLLRPRIPVPASQETEADPDMGRPRFKIGVARLKVDVSEKISPLVITPNKTEFFPGEDVTLDIVGEPGAEVALSVADRAVLDLVAYRYSDPMITFYRDWPHGVQVFENRRSIIRQYSYSRKGNAPGGKGWDDQAGQGGFAYDSDDATRRDFRYTAYWNPDISLDAAGKARITFRLPHNLTTFMIQAVSSKEGKFGRHISEFRVRRAVVAQQLSPSFIRRDDRLEIGGVFVNNTGRTGQFKITLRSPLLSVSGAAYAEKVVAIPAGGSLDVAFASMLNTTAFEEMRKKQEASGGGVPEVTGSIGMEALNPSEFPGYAARDLVDRMEFHFPVREYPPSEAFTISGFTDAKSEEFLRLPDRARLVPGSGRLQISLSSTALTGLGQAFDFYGTNPYFCLEQRASAYLASISAGELLRQFGYHPPDDRSYDFSKIEDLFLGEINDFQNADGSFRAWKNDPTGQPYLTAYVLTVLHAARQKGGRVDRSTEEKAFTFLSDYARRPPPDELSYILSTFALSNYANALYQRDSTPLEDYLLQNQDKLSLRSKAYLALALAIRGGSRITKSGDLLRQIENRMQFNTQRISFDEVSLINGRAYQTAGSTAGVILKLALKLKPDSPLIPPIIRNIVEDRSRMFWRDSHSAGVTAQALKEYADAFETKASESLRGKITLEARQLVEGVFQGRTAARSTSLIPADSLYSLLKPDTNYPMAIERSSGNGRLYYTATFLYSPVLERVAPRDEGMEVRREIASLSSQSPTGPVVIRADGALKRGDLYLNRLIVVNPKPIFQFVLTDPLASGMEAVNTSFSTESASYSRFLEKKRETGGRTWWWESSQDNYEYRIDRVILTKSYLTPGVHEFFYLSKPLLRGRSYWPAAEAKAMYEPEIFGRTGANWTEIQ